MTEPLDIDAEEAQSRSKTIIVIRPLDGEIQVMHDDGIVAIIVILGDGTAVRTFLNEEQAACLMRALAEP